jgi:hypothetical protein
VLYRGRTLLFKLPESEKSGFGAQSSLKDKDNIRNIECGWLRPPSEWSAFQQNLENLLGSSSDGMYMH